MNCPKCNRPLAVGDGYCQSCGTGVGSDNAFLGLKRRGVVEMGKKLSSPLFLVLSIILSLVCVGYLICVAESAVRMPLVAFLCVAAAVCSIVSNIFSYLIFASRGNAKTKFIRSLNVFYVMMTVGATMECIFAGIVSGFVLVICIILTVVMLVAANAADAAEEIIDKISTSGSADAFSELLESGGIAVLLAGIIASALIMFIFICKLLAFKNSGKYVKALAQFNESGEYDKKRAPKVQLWMFGVISVLLSVLCFGFSVGYGVCSLAMGAYMIVSAILFGQIHELAKNESYVPTTSIVNDNSQSIKAVSVPEATGAQSQPAVQERPTYQAQPQYAQRPTYQAPPQYAQGRQYQAPPQYGAYGQGGYAPQNQQYNPYTQGGYNPYAQGQQYNPYAQGATPAQGGYAAQTQSPVQNNRSAEPEIADAQTEKPEANETALAPEAVNEHEEAKVPETVSAEPEAVETEELEATATETEQTATDTEESN